MLRGPDTDCEEPGLSVLSLQDDPGRGRNNEELMRPLLLPKEKEPRGVEAVAVVEDII
jgi:hypothetical protein